MLGITAALCAASVVLALSNLYWRMYKTTHGNEAKPVLQDGKFMTGEACGAEIEKRFAEHKLDARKENLFCVQGRLR